jgi:hypothetical protein
LSWSTGVKWRSTEHVKTLEFVQYTIFSCIATLFLSPVSCKIWWFSVGFFWHFYFRYGVSVFFYIIHMDPGTIFYILC